MRPHVYPASDVERTRAWLTAHRTCIECGRVFDMADADDADEWHHGHDCEA